MKNAIDKIGLTKQTKEILIRRLIILSWSILLVCSCIKLLGFNLFSIVCENQRFIAICKYFDNNAIPCYILALFTSFIGCALLTLSMLCKLKFSKKELIIFSIGVIVGTTIKTFTEYGFVGDLIQCFIIPVILMGKKYWRYINILILNIVNVVFQLISIYVKDVRFSVFDDNTLVSLILLIDMYIMLLLYYLYTNLKGDIIMGKFFTWFFGKDSTQLKSMKEKREARLAKLDPKKDADEIENIKNEIEMINEKLAKI